MNKTKVFERDNVWKLDYKNVKHILENMDKNKLNRLKKYHWDIRNYYCPKLLPKVPEATQEVLEVKMHEYEEKQIKKMEKRNNNNNTNDNNDGIPELNQNLNELDSAGMVFS